MSVEIKVPVLPESVADATIATWHKKPGETVARDENLVDIETDKVVLEVVAPSDGTITKILHEEGATVKAQEVIALFESGADAGSQPVAESPSTAADNAVVASSEQPELSPSARRAANEQGVNVANLSGTGKGGRITKHDVNAAVTSAANASPTATGERIEKRVPMTRLRSRIAERLLQAQQNAAILTTFNEIDMQPVMQLRNQYKDIFEKKHGVRLGFMSFFVMAVVEALKSFPAVNASIDGKDIVYHGYFDIGVAVSSPRGLVVPILRDVDTMSMAEVEKKIREFGAKAKEGQLTIDEMTGGTFTISNGGVFGSLMSTPILNPPQSGILGMHKIEQRAVVENGNIVAKPMMYVALSYDHRIIDGAESVQFLVTIKNVLEEPARLLLSV